MNLPQLTKEKLLQQVARAGHKMDPFTIVGIRGYFKNTMGKPAENDRAIYDDAMFIVTDTEFHAFNANCDPSKYRTGIASLVPGKYPAYKFDIHGGKVSQYPAICQRLDEVTVTRDGGEKETGMFGINIHKGGNTGTSSEGCQTIPPDQWARFYNTAKRIFQGLYGDDWNEAPVTYILLEQ